LEELWQNAHAVAEFYAPTAAGVMRHLAPHKRSSHVAAQLPAATTRAGWTAKSG